MIHQSHPEVLARLRRAQGHLATVIQMIEAGRPCADLAQQLHAVEKAIGNAKRGLIQDHIDHCLDGAVAQGGRSAKDAMAEIKAITKYL
jgi:DNA-binding FrmR family transcriptional regulator